MADPATYTHAYLPTYSDPLNLHNYIILRASCLQVTEHWQLKPEVSWIQLPAFHYFHLITSKFIYRQVMFQHDKLQLLQFHINLP